jgi:hypothetical protein
LSSANSKQRAQAISHFLDIAAACIEENNFNTALAIFTAMNAVSISRLKSTWVVRWYNTFAIIMPFANGIVIRAESTEEVDQDLGANRRAI